ncbi:hypothetical protein AAFF_G00037880 [Aldrovandia affinis]|uniref:Uncharacterized protein n=1 Tax=Aldrovandia affinis TaxID=143900 RepID=A0AAD7T570_9TELE|nr:hypothetical protein AAFF_G00037880 [Aldrovandia affinis]
MAFDPTCLNELVRVCLENLNDDNTELWLIKAPVNFNPDSLSGVRVPTEGLETLQRRGRVPQLYSVLGRPGVATAARLLTAARQRPGDMLCGPAFAGLLNVCDSYGDHQGNQAPVAIPACPAPGVPEGLRQRFQPFGSRAPSGQAPSGHGQEDAPTTLAKRIKLEPEEGKGQKKKKKKDKRMEMEDKMEEEIMAEPLPSRGSTETPQDVAPKEEEEGVVEEKKKKKKKKKKKSKDRGGGEREQAGTGVEVGLSLKEEVKSEPVDPAYGDLPNPGKKRKKVKKERKELDD